MHGSGTLLDPYIIENITDFQNINLHPAPGTYYELGSDIDASGFGFVPITNFGGSLDGKGHTVDSLSENRSQPAVFNIVSGSITHLGITNINFTSSDGSAACGFCNLNNGTITNCYITGVLHNIGGAAAGFAGFNNPPAAGVITNCYSTVVVTPTAVPFGFCGNNTGTITSCYWDTDVSGTLNSNGGTGETTILMKKQATFIGWDFTTIWKITEDVTYPTFKGSTPPVPPYQSPPCIIDFKGILDCIKLV